MFWWCWQVAASVMQANKDLQSIIYGSGVHHVGKFFQLCSIQQKQGKWPCLPLLTEDAKGKGWSNTGTSRDSPGSEVKSRQASLEFLCLALNRREQEQDVSCVTVSRTESKSLDLGEVTDQSGMPGEEPEKITTLQPQTEMLIRDNTQSG